jgi:Ran GTPase-activating protein (RanGAP) involved in mRNA processing and transport
METYPSLFVSALFQTPQEATEPWGAHLCSVDLSGIKLAGKGMEALVLASRHSGLPVLKTLMLEECLLTPKANTILRSEGGVADPLTLCPISSTRLLCSLLSEVAPSLTALSLAGNALRSREARLVMAALKGCLKLREVGVHNNGIGALGFLHFFPTCFSWDSVNFSSNSISTDAGTLDELRERDHGQATLVKLRGVDVSHNNVNAEVLEWMSKVCGPALGELWTSGNQLGDEMCTRLLGHVSDSNSKLTILDMGENGFLGDSTSALVAAFADQRFSALREVWLHGNGLHDVHGARAIRALTPLRTLERIDLSQNRLGSLTAALLLPFIREDPKRRLPFRKLDISENQMGASTLRQIVAGFQEMVLCHHRYHGEVAIEVQNYSLDIYWNAGVNPAFVSDAELNSLPWLKMSQYHEI